MAIRDGAIRPKFVGQRLLALVFPSASIINWFPVSGFAVVSAHPTLLTVRALLPWSFGLRSGSRPYGIFRQALENDGPLPIPLGTGSP